LKFASVIGEVLADLATGRSPAFDPGLFRLDRLAASDRPEATAGTPS
jgi:glycine/D-amino acid oxidase-like deaminating enzyme